MSKMENKPKTACVEMTGPDVQMDQHGSSYEPANRLPARCRHCSLPNLDFVPQPYLLTKGISSPSEISPAQMGNFLVRKRVRDILELVSLRSCQFYPTQDKKTGKQTEWLLAVPTRVLKLPGREPRKPFCLKCREPKIGYHWADHAKFMALLKEFDSLGVDIFKSQDWYSGGAAEDDFNDTNRYREESGLPPQSWKESIHWAIPGLEPPTHAGRWTRTMLTRELFFSVRLEQLLKRLKIKGQLVRYIEFKDVKTTPEDEAWIQEKLQLLAKHGLVDAPEPAAGKSASAAQKWFKQFLKRNAQKGLKPLDFAAVEQMRKLTLPQEYKDFIATVGPKSFADVCDMEGSTTTVLPPRKLDFKDYRCGKVPNLEGEDAEVDGVMFAANDGGDCFVFDVSAKGDDYPVYWHRHEESILEPYAPNFAECIKRFVQKT